MITIVRIGFLRLRNNPLEAVLMFIVPIAFFSIFALIFGRGIGSGTTPAVRVALVDEDRTDLSRNIVERLASDEGLRQHSDIEDDGATTIDQASARKLVQDGLATIAIVIPSGFSERATVGDKELPVRILADTSDQVATQVVGALVRQAIMIERSQQAARQRRSLPQAASPPVVGAKVPASPHDHPIKLADGRSLQTNLTQELDSGIGNRSTPRAAPPSGPILFQPGSKPTRMSKVGPPIDARELDGKSQLRNAGAVVEARSDADSSAEPSIETTSAESLSATGSDPDPESAANSNVVEIEDILAADKANPTISMYAAGIAVMFLLFSASGAGGTLLEERETGTLERLLSSRLTINQLLTGKWLLITLTGSVQVLVMFVWAQLVFDVDLIGHWQGFAVMTLSTAAAASSLGLCLATACRSRAQLNGVSVILILTMSALGGSMVPRYLMSDEMRHIGLVTFNAWALDGFNKVFWRDQPVSALTPQLGVLLIAALALGIAARLFAMRWEE